MEPYFSDNSSHLHPTVRTNRIPLIVVRSSHLGLPVLAGFGKCFTIDFHWGNQKINLSWTYHIDESQVGFPEDGYFVIEITGIETVIEKANFVEENKFAGQYEGIDPGVGGGTVTITVISFIGDEWNYGGDGNQEEVIIPPNTS